MKQKPSPTLLQWSEKIARDAPGPILDAPCGYGRHAFLMQSYGRSVICVDRSLKALRTFQTNATHSPGGGLIKLALDLKSWPFKENSLGAILNVHFVHTFLLSNFVSSLRKGGFLYCETFSGHGGNYLQLPRAGEWENLLKRYCRFEFYSERRVGPPNCDAVAVKLLARMMT